MTTVRASSFTGPVEVITFGETMALMRAESPGPLAQARSLGLGIGGAESNFAIALRRLGTSVAWAGRVGNDSLGDLVVRELMAEGLEVIALRDYGAPTGLMIKERRTPDAVKVWYYRSGSAGSRLTREDVPVGLIDTARLLHITGITPGLSSSASDAVDYAIDRARTSGKLVSFDLNYRAALWAPEKAGPHFRRLTAQSDIVFAGDDEAGIAVGPGTSLELAHRLSDLGPSQAIIKRGPAGCVAVVDGVEYEADALKIQPVDTVGAGDAFVAGYVSEHLRGSCVEERLSMAVRTGAFACLVPGDWEGMPRRGELALLEAIEPVAR
ncbi:sugar kinase [Arthrobacter sp. MA-N2]|uniref:sugar kinase n=1 Tax=Arthrobacter sp. MA-N2 TaxID=1101188 RepID=UPI0004B963AD|nr:sugar kinase [Arthrobacter sp. MA-N2]